MLEAKWNCPLCHSAPGVHDYFDYVNDRVLTEDGELPTPVFYFYCKQCGMVFQRMGLTDEAMALYYEAPYRATIQGGPSGVTERALAEQTARAEVLLPMLHELFPAPVMRFLDIGSSAGILMDGVLDDEIAENVYGVEPGIEFAEYTKKELGHASVYKTIQDIPESLYGKFDLVSAIHTLEHTSAPGDMLRFIREELIAEDGRLVIEVPDLYGEWTVRRLAHPVIFTISSLSQLLSLTGWEIVSIENYPGLRDVEDANIYAVAKPAEKPESIVFENDLDLDLYDERVEEYTRKLRKLNAMRLG